MRVVRGAFSTILATAVGLAVQSGDASSEPTHLSGTAEPSVHAAFQQESIDALEPSSPAGTHVLAEIPRLYGPTFTAQMTYYTTGGGAKVFSSGAFNFVESIFEPDAPLPSPLARQSAPGVPACSRTSGPAWLLPDQRRAR